MRLRDQSTGMQLPFAHEQLGFALPTKEVSAEQGIPLTEPSSLWTPLRAFSVAWIVMIALSLAVSCLEYRAGFPKTRWYPLSDPLLGDFMEYPATYRLLHAAAFFYNLPEGLPAPMFSAVAYPPFAAALLAPIYLLGNPIINILGLATIVLLAGLWYARRTLVEAGVDKNLATLSCLIIAGTSFPLLRLLHQGNVELILWVFAAAGIAAFLRGRENAAAMLWGCAAAMKLYPLVLLLLLVPKRRYGALALGIGVFALATWLSLVWLGPTAAIAWHGSLQNVFGYQSLRVQEWSLNELVANHSGFELIKLVAAVTHHSFLRLTLPYYAGCGLLILWVFFKRAQKLPIANQVLVATVFMVLVPTVSYYHTLVHLFAPLLLLVVVARTRSEPVPGLRMTLLLFVPLFAPYTLFTFPHALLMCGLVQALLLLALLLCALQFPFANSSEQEMCSAR